MSAIRPDVKAGPIFLKAKAEKLCFAKAEVSGSGLPLFVLEEEIHSYKK